MQHEQNLLPSGEGKLGYQDTDYLEPRGELTCCMPVPSILAKGSGNSQWHVQPLLHLKEKLRAPQYELEQSGRNYQLNLRTNRGSERVTPQLPFSSAVYYFKGALCKNYVAF